MPAIAYWNRVPWSYERHEIGSEMPEMEFAAGESLPSGLISDVFLRNSQTIRLYYTNERLGASRRELNQ